MKGELPGGGTQTTPLAALPVRVPAPPLQLDVPGRWAGDSPPPTPGRAERGHREPQQRPRTGQGGSRAQQDGGDRARRGPRDLGADPSPRPPGLPALTRRSPGFLLLGKSW